MDCEQLAANLTDFLEGSLSTDQQAAALEHLATCPSCELVLADTISVIELLQTQGKVTVSTEDRSRLLLGITDQLRQQ